MLFDFVGDSSSSGSGWQLPQSEVWLGGSSANPMAELMRAMVLRVVDDVRAGGELREDALLYMDSEEGDDDYVLSFRNVASYLGVCPARLREAILDTNRAISTRRRAA